MKKSTPEEIDAMYNAIMALYNNNPENWQLLPEILYSAFEHQKQHPELEPLEAFQAGIDEWIK